MTIREIPVSRIRAVAPSGVMAAHWAAVGLVACIVACSSIWRYFDATTTSTTAAWQDFVFEKVAAGATCP